MSLTNYIRRLVIAIFLIIVPVGNKLHLL